MSERKKLKDVKTTDNAKELLELLQSIPDGNREDIDTNTTIQKSMCNLKIREARIFAILCICEISRITKSSDFLDESQMDILFDSVLKSLSEKTIDLSKLISSGLISRFRNSSMISKFIEIYQKTIHNKESIREIIAIMIENSEDKEKLIDTMLKKSDHYSDIISRISNLIDIDKLDEDLYIKIYASNQFFRENTNPRVVRGKKRLEFVKYAVSVNLEFTLTNYIKDRDKRIRIILADNVQMHNEPFLSILMNDSDEDVRHTLIKKFNYRNMPESIYDRVLDKSSKVRNEVLRIYKETVEYLNSCTALKNENIFEKSHSGRLNFTNESGVEDAEFDEIYSKFNRLLEKVFEGCLTGIPEDYIAAINQSNFSLNFLSENKELHGMRKYLETRPITDYRLVPLHLRSFCLDFMFKGVLPSSYIRDCLQEDIFEAIKFIEDPYEHFDLLVEKALNLEDLDLVEKITEFIKPVLKFRDPIFKSVIRNEDTMKDTVIDDSGVFMEETGKCNSFEFSIPNELFLNAHTKLDEMFVERNTGEISDFAHLYFVVYRSPSRADIIKCISESQTSVFQKIRLLVYLNRTDVLEEFGNILVKYPLDSVAESFLLGGKNIVSTLIYFLCTGLVALSNPSFFIKAIKCSLKSTKPDKVAQIFGKYMRSVGQDAFNLFYSICWTLKDFSVTNLANDSNSVGNLAITEPQEESIILNPLIVDSLIKKPSLDDNTKLSSIEIEDTKISTFNVENIVNKVQSVNSNDAKTPMLKLTLKDKMLHHICNVVISSREGKLLSTKFNPEKYGFFKLQDHHIEMIGYNQVVYE